jgi:hypothetical protein
MKHIPVTRSLLLLAIAGFLVDGSCTLAAQQVGGLLVFGSSDHPELSNANGWGAFAAAPIASWMQFRLSYHRVSQDSQSEGWVCLRYAPSLGCNFEEIETTQSLGSLRVSLLPRVTVRDALQIGAGGGVSFNQVSVEAIGTATGRKANLDAPRTGQIGYQGMASVAFTPVERVPLTAIGQFTAHWVNFRNCVSYEDVYDPYCGVYLFKEVSLGLAWKF